MTNTNNNLTLAFYYINQKWWWSSFKRVERRRMFHFVEDLASNLFHFSATTAHSAESGALTKRKYSPLHIIKKGSWRRRRRRSGS